MSPTPWDDETAQLGRPEPDAWHAPRPPRHGHWEQDETVVRSPLFAQDPEDLPAPRRKVFPRGWRDAMCAAWTLAGLLMCVLIAAVALAAWHLGGPLNGGHP